MNKLAAGLAMLAAYSLSAAVHAQSRFEEDFDDKEKPWQELVVQIPAAPKEENLLPFEAGPGSGHRFAIDAKSLSIGADGIIRYTLVAKSGGGAVNVSYEGIRCATGEKKLYAFGHRDGTWTRSRRDQWEPITSAVINAQHAALARDYFCDTKLISGSAEEILDRLRWNRRLQRDGMTTTR